MTHDPHQQDPQQPAQQAHSGPPTWETAPVGSGPYAPIPPVQPPKKKRHVVLWVLGGLFLGFIALGIIGSALDGDGGAAPVTTTESPTVGETEATTTEAPTPEPTTEEPTTPEPTPEPEPTTTEPLFDSTDYDTTIMLVEITWAGTDQESKDSICWGVNYLGVEWAVDTMLESSDVDFNREALADFFLEVCDG